MEFQATEVAPLVFRLATRDDVAPIIHMLADDFLGKGRDDAREPLGEAYYAAFDALETDPNNELYVVERAGEIVGTFHLTFIPGLSNNGAWRAQIEAVRVASPHRGRGIGKQMFDWTADRARQRGCRVLQLTTHIERKDAHRFYERLGFVSSQIGMKLKL
jgi:GNAT superfamily N-acetyltransferase